MNTFTPAFQTIANTCGLCHDQCVSSCPVVESSHSLVAYPSRLAALALEISRAGLELGPDAWQALAHCIHCNACTQNCVYIDQPVDVTPLVRWARQTLIDHGRTGPVLIKLMEKISREGSPFGNIAPTLERLKSEHPGNFSTGGTLVIADASQLALDLPSAQAALRLLSRLGYANIHLSSLTYTGWELWQYGCRSAAIEIARGFASEVERTQPEVVITLAPSSAYLLRHVYPKELEVVVPTPVMTLPEAVLERIALLSPPHTALPGPVFLAPSHTELYQLRSSAAREVLERCGVTLAASPDRQPFRPAAYPEGACLELDPPPGPWIAQRIARLARAANPALVLCTTAFTKQAMQAALPEIPVGDWPGFVLNHLSS